MFWCCFTLHLRRRSRKFPRLGVRLEVAVTHERPQATLFLVNIRDALIVYGGQNIGIDRKMAMPFILPLFPVRLSIMPHFIQYTHSP